MGAVGPHTFDGRFLIGDTVDGIIVMWSGAIVDIPAGWHLCDGTEGTPDLRNRFIVCAGDTYRVNGQGGDASHGHDFETSGHEHDIDTGIGIAAGEAYDSTTDSEQDEGSTTIDSNLPPYYALCFIMFIGIEP